jgi:ribosome-binding protein aMBF1 (putative translation factor)
VGKGSERKGGSRTARTRREGDDLVDAAQQLIGKTRSERPNESYLREVRNSQRLANVRRSRVVEGRSDRRRTRAQLVGANIRRARERAFLSQAALAERLGIRHHHLSDYERGLHEPSAVRLERIADILDIAEPAYFFIDPIPGPISLDELDEEESVA